MQDAVLIIGFGYAGRRFAQVVRHLEASDPGRVRLAGICDADPRARAAAERLAPTFDALETAIRAARPTAVVVAVNEIAHADVLARLSAFPQLAVLCEKPLTTTWAEAAALPRTLVDMPLTVNLVERHSPVLADYREWAASRSVRPLRVEFFWGKHRIADRRPTMGVLSELTHPLDLADHLFGFERLEEIHAYGVSSDYSPHCARSLDTVSLSARADDYVLLGASSFAWPRRHRTVTALLADDRNALFRATVDFDMPRWDCDHLKIERIHAGSGAVETVLERRTTNEQFPADLHGVAKVASYVVESLEHARAPQRPHRLVDHAQALKIQGTLERVAASLDASVTHVDVVAGGHGDALAPALPQDASATGASFVPEEGLV